MEKTTLLQQRNDDLRAAYKRIVKASANMKYVSRATIISLLMEQPAPRFYLLPYQARMYIVNHYRMVNSGRRKQKMIEDLVENYERLRNEYPGAARGTLYCMAAEQPAKSFYLSKHRIEEILFDYSGRN